MASGNKRISRRIIAALLLLYCSCAYGAEEWHLVNEYITPLIAVANSQDLGQVIYRDYERYNPAGLVTTILTKGVGTGALYVPEKVNAAKGLMPADSSYEVLEVVGRKAILENQSYMPLALAVHVDDNTILTIESISLNHDEIIKFAEEILLQEWNAIKSD